MSLLRITRPLRAAGAEPRASNDLGTDEALEELDVEAVAKPAAAASTAQRPSVLYDVVHSPSYQVPVLYLTFLHISQPGLPSPDEVYSLLVPDTHKPQLQTVGVMGALSMADHPTTGTPSYFVHPCQTQTAMAAVTAGRTMKPEEYLLVWLGLVGQSVGLSVPIGLAQALSSS